MKCIECCAYCGAEVEILAKLVQQTCPECGENILACSYCIDVYKNCVSPCRVPPIGRVTTTKVTYTNPFLLDARELTEEEEKIISDACDAMFKPTGFNLFGPHAFPLGRNLTEEELRGVQKLLHEMSEPTGRKAFPCLENEETLKLYKMEYGHYDWQSGRYDSELFVARTRDEASLIADKKAEERSTTFKTYHALVEEVVLDGYDIIIKKK